MTVTAAPARTGRRRLDWVGFTARLVLGGVLLVAGALKVGNLDSSVYATRAYQLLPFELTAPVGYGLPLIEVAAGLLLVLGVFTRWSALVGSLLMVAFLVAIGSAWARGLSIDCGCFGGGGEIERAKAIASYPWEMLRDAGLLACGLWLVILPRTPLALEDRLFPPIVVDDSR